MSEKVIALPSERSERWVQLRALAAEWGHPFLEQDAIPLSALEKNEQRLGFTLPAALKEWYRIAGTWPNKSRGTNFLFAPEELVFELEDPDYNFLAFYEEVQFTAWWGIARSDLILDDPPIFVHYAEERVQDATSLSEFMFAVTLREVMTLQDFYGFALGQPEAVKAVGRHFWRFGVSDLHWPEYPTRFYRGSDVLIQTYGADELEVIARTSAAISEVEEIIGLTLEH